MQSEGREFASYKRSFSNGSRCIGKSNEKKAANKQLSANFLKQFPLLREVPFLTDTDNESLLFGIKHCTVLQIFVV